MKKKEKEFLRELGQSVNSKVEFCDISKEIDERKRNRKLYQRTFILKLTTILGLCLMAATGIVIRENSFKVDDKDYTKYNGYIKQYYEKVADQPFSDGSTGPVPNYAIESVVTENELFGGHNSYLYEVEYKKHENEKYIAAYIEKNLANNIYEKNKLIMDAPNASPLNIVDGSIVKWCYSKDFYDVNKVRWYEFENAYEIPTDIEGYHCSGIYMHTVRSVLKEVISDTHLNYEDEIYTSLYFTNDGNEFLTPQKYTIDECLKWYVNKVMIDEENYRNLFRLDFNLDINATIQNGELTIMTYAVSSTDELAKIDDQVLVDFYIQTNSYVIRYDNRNDDFGYGIKREYTYNYAEYVEALRSTLNHY